MRTWKMLLALGAACMLALPACSGDDEPEVTKEVCNNNIDDDGNGKTDCADSACAADAACKNSEICDNTTDDDGDGKADCDDSDCAAAANCQSQCQPGESVCGSNCCTAGQSCVNGTCQAQQCGTNQTACGNTCCNADQVCVAGTCQAKPQCNANETQCGSNCCTAGQVCNNGTCEAAPQCNVGETVCGPNCCTAGQICQNNACVTPTECNPGETVCGSDCCVAGELCNEGTCESVTVCDADQTACGMTCCGAGQVCNAGACEGTVTCGTDETACGNDCCASGDSCVANSCVAANPGSCLLAASYGTIVVTGDTELGDGYMLLQGSLPSADGTDDRVQIEMYEGSGVFTGGFQTGVFPITGDELNYKTCGLCVRLLADIDAATERSTAAYLATGGTVAITSVSGALRAAMSAGTFEHVDIASDYTSTPNADGCTTAISRVEFNGTLPAVCDPLDPNCAPGEGCYYDGAQFSCVAAGTVPVGGECDGTVGQCAPGAECMNPGICALWCDPQNPSCPTGLECQPVTQDGSLGSCLEPLPLCDPLNPTCATGEGCYYDTDAGDFLCAPEGTVAIGDACTATGECVPGAECMNPGICSKLCDPQNPVCPGTQECEAITDDGTLGACFQPVVVCNPLDPVECTIAGDNCSFDQNEGDFICKPAGATAVGAACTATGECVAGAECLSGFCRDYCDPATAGSCANGAVCEDVVGDNSVGLCYEDCATAGDEDGNGLADCDDAVCAQEQVCLAALCTSAGQTATGLTFTADNTNGTMGMRGSCGGAGKEVFYTLTAGNSGEIGQLKVEVTTEFDAVVYARSACDDVSSQLGCADKVTGSAGTPKTETLIVNDFAGGSSFTLFLDAYKADATGVGTFNVVVSYEPRVCGDGVVQYGEDCEPDAANEATDGCNPDCTLAPAEIAVPYTDPFLAGSIAAGEVDWVRVDLATDGSLEAEILDGGTGACAAEELDSKLGLFDVDGNLIVEVDDGGAGYCSKMHIPHLSAGSYLLKVYGYDTDTEFDYQLKVTIGAVETCTAPASYGSPTATNGYAEPILYWGIFEIGLAGSFDINGDPDQLLVDLYDGAGPFTNGIVPGTYQLTGDEIDPAKCSICLRIVEENGRQYIPTGGSVTLTSTQGNLTGSLDNVAFQEAIGANPVPNACTTDIVSVSFDTVITTSK